MKAILLVVSLVLFAAASFGATPETQRKNSELLKFLHYTRELAEFRERIKVGIDELKKANPDASPRFWDDLARDVRTDEYTEWVMALLDRVLTEKDVRDLNVIASDPKKYAGLVDMLKQLDRKRGPELTAAIEKFKRSYERRLADELIAFTQSDTAGRYAAFRELKATGQTEMVTKLLAEAHKRLSARQKK